MPQPITLPERSFILYANTDIDEWKQIEERYSWVAEQGGFNFNAQKLKQVLMVNSLDEIGCLTRTNRSRVVKTLQNQFGFTELISYRIYNDINKLYEYKISEVDIDLWKMNFPQLIPLIRKLLLSTTNSLSDLVCTIVQPDNNLLPKEDILRHIETILRKEAQRLILEMRHSTSEPLEGSVSPILRGAMKGIDDLLATHSDQIQSAVEELFSYQRDLIGLRYRIEQLPEKPQPKRRIACSSGKENSIEFDRWIFEEVIDTPPFQRLSRIKQLGACHLVYPLARHTRFEHSLGVAHLAEIFWNKLLKASSYGPMTSETAHVRDCLIIAGLCHDLGHGPFSHTFETSFVNKHRSANAPWHHEEMSLKLFDVLCMDHLNIDDVDMKMVRDMIIGIPPCSGKTYCGDTFENLRHASYSIIANRKSGVDVDRFDYLERDSKITENLPCFKADRIMDFARVIDGEICFEQKEQRNVFDMFVCRNRMFQEVYTHRKVRALEFMICDALECLDDVLHISSMVDDPIEFLALDDSILENCIRDARHYKPDDDYYQNFERARQLSKRMESRDTYRFAGDCVLLGSLERIKDHFTTDKIVAAQTISENTVPFNEDDIILDWAECHYGTSSQNPMDLVSFYDPKNPTLRLKIPLPEERTWLTAGPRVFTRRNDTATALSQAFKNWLSEYVPQCQRGLSVAGCPRQPAVSPSRHIVGYSHERSTHGSLSIPHFPSFDCAFSN